MCWHDHLCSLAVPASLGCSLRTWLVAFGHSWGLVVRLAHAWVSEVPMLSDLPYRSTSCLPCLRFFCSSAGYHTCAGISMCEVEGSCAGDNPPSALTIDQECCHFRITLCTLISGGFNTIQSLLSEWPLPLLLTCTWTKEDFSLLLARGGEVRRRKSLGGQVTGGERAGKGLLMADVRVHVMMKAQPSSFLST